MARGSMGALTWIRARSPVRCTTPSVLIADNEPLIAERVGHYLLPRYRAFQAARPLRLEDVSVPCQPALIVLNPELLVKGCEDALNTTHARVPLIVVSSGPAAIGAVDALDAGADDYLP